MTVTPQTYSLNSIGLKDPIDPKVTTTATAASLAALLAACGGGGGGSSDAVTPAAPTPTVAPTAVQSARFLGQASLATTDTDQARVQSVGYAAWIDEQIAAPSAQSHWDWLVSKGYNEPVQYRNSQAGADNTMWRKLIASPDPMRQRVVFALAEIFVISLGGLAIGWRQFICAAYLDMLEANCFGTYRNLLDKVTLSIGMGAYLNMRGNQKEDPTTGRQPDENYAREVLQLFSLGLVKLNTDGTPQTGAGGAPIDTYDQATIAGLAKVFTGWDYAAGGASLATAPDKVRLPMEFNATRFSPSPKTFLGVTIPGSTDGVTALGIALDTIANHPNVGPFFGRQLIQRLVTSNPSAAYVGRVAAIFNNNGAGVRGDLKAVIKAVLLDPEARTAEINPSPTWGKVREPMVRFVQWARTFGVTSPTDLWNIGDTTDPARRLGQSPLRSPSVFNFFRPGYVPPNTAIGTQGLVAPELQITNESTVVGYANYMQTAIVSGVGEVRPNYTGEMTRATDAAGLVERYALLLAGGQLSDATKASIRTAVETISPSTDAGKLNRIYATIMLVMCSPEYIVQK